ncbi:MAG: hypothetical protein JRI23_30000 [Deltaproteobacteria bacterium]|jgi:hypothetical protein|nr:hypothetical protein [Deltaproteobacteria bacterium]MBW2536384.1 hypothetical protein [Deltaproteobacteria bacterium]
MNRWLVYSLTAAFALMGTTACNSTCDDICSHYASCDPDFLLGDLGCEWKDSEDEVEEKCLDSCESEYDRLSDGDREEVDLCVECVFEEIGDSCDEGEQFEVVYDECDRECDDSDVGDFFEDFYDDWDLADEIEDCNSIDYPTG